MQVEAPSQLPTETAQAPRRLDSSLLDKSLDELIKANRAERKNKPKGAGKAKGKAPAQPQNGGVKKFFTKAHRNRQAQGNQNLKTVNENKPNSKIDKGNNNRQLKNSQKAPRNTPVLRQPWEKPASLPLAPLPDQPLKISIRNELAEKRSSSADPYAMDWSSSATSSSRYEARDRVEGRKEYRLGSRYSTQPMNIDYDLGRRY